MSWKRLSWLLVPVLVLGFVAGCSDDDDNGTNPPVPVDQYDVVRSAAADYITYLGSSPVVSAQHVFDNLSTDYELSVRSTAHYEKGHVPGAEVIHYVKVADPATDLSGIPTSGPVSVYCYTGHTGGLAATMLGLMGYDAKNLKYGIMAWTDVDSVRVASPFSEDMCEQYATETTDNPLTTDYGLPTLDVTDSEDAATIIRMACDAYLNKFDGTGVGPTIGAADVFARNVTDGDPSNDYFILSVRSAAHYALGHLPGAYNIPWNQIADPANLAKLPHDKTIVVYCYTGHTGAIAAGILGALGYDTLNMRHGIMSWTSDAAVRAQNPFREDVDCKKFRYVTGPDPGE